MFNHDLTLIREISTGERDKDDNLITTERRRTILCAERAISRNEFYSAAQAGLEVSANVLVNPIEYQGEEIVEFKNKTYSVIKTYHPVYFNGKKLLEITLGEKVAR